MLPSLNREWHLVENDISIERLLETYCHRVASTGFVVRETVPFRRLARFVNPTCDIVVEVGCSTGKTTTIIERIFKIPKRILAVDVSKKVIKKCVQDLSSNIRFVDMDVLQEWPHFVLLVENLRQNSGLENSELVIFIDIGGDREMAPIVAMIALLDKELHPKMILIKNRDLHTALKTHGINWDLINQLSKNSLKSRDYKESTNPLKKPIRLNSNGVSICRFFNSKVGCLKGDRCEFDHSSCYGCGIDGHLLNQCTTGGIQEPLLVRLLDEENKKPSSFGEET